MARAHHGGSLAWLLSGSIAAGALAWDAPAAQGVASAPTLVVQGAAVTPGSRVAVGMGGATAPGATFQWKQVEGPSVAIEDPSAGFAVGVLWHPEESAEGGAPLFAELVQRARSHVSQA